jgi:hypothetical protein
MHTCIHIHVHTYIHIHIHPKNAYGTQLDLRYEAYNLHQFQKNFSKTAEDHHVVFPQVVAAHSTVLIEVCICVHEFVCVCVRERERESVCVCTKISISIYVCLCVWM